MCAESIQCNISWWRNQMETFSALLALCAGNSPVTDESPHKGQWRGALMFFYICAWINGWVNNREADDLRRHRVRYYVILMYMLSMMKWKLHQHSMMIYFHTIFVVRNKSKYHCLRFGHSHNGLLFTLDSNKHNANQMSTRRWSYTFASNA